MTEAIVTLERDPCERVAILRAFVTRPLAAKMSRWRYAIAFLLLIAVIAAGTGVAWAHPFLIHASPPPDTIVRQAPTRVQLDFSEDLNSSGSTITVVDPHHRAVSIGHAVFTRGNRREMAVPLRTLLPGVYLVQWTAVSSEDGHFVQGYYVFGFKVRRLGSLLSGATSGSGQGFPDPETLAALLSHFLLLLAAVAWFGSSFFSAYVLPASVEREDLGWGFAEAWRRRNVVRLALTVVILANVIGLLIEAHQLGGENWQTAHSSAILSALFADQYGRLWIVQQVIAVLALATTITISTRRPVPKWLALASAEGGSWHMARWVQVALGAVFLYALAASGHAASAAIGAVSGSHLVSASVLVDLLHLLAAGLWLGGQIYIALVLIPALRPDDPLSHGGRPFLDILDRYSPVAYAGVGLFVVTGPFNAKIHLPSWSAFFDTLYGRALSVKVILIVMMMLVSAFTVFVLRPRIRQMPDFGPGTREINRRSSTSRLLSWLRLNPLLGAGVLLATSVMFFYPVPAGLSAIGPPGPTWRAGGLQGITVHFLALGHRDPALVFAGTEHGVYRQRTGGTWQRLLSAQTVWSIALLDDDRTLLAGDQAGDVYVSRDRGSTWRRNLVTSQGVYAVSGRPGDAQWLLAGAGEGLYLSRDGGAHWRRRLFLPQSGGATFAWQTRSSRVVFAGVVAGGRGGSTGVYVSRDAGVTWHVFGHGLNSGGGIMSLATIPTHQIFAGTMGHAAWTSGVTNDTWKSVAHGMPLTNDHVAGIASVPGLPGTLFVGTLGYGVFRTDDGGSHWRNISAGLPASRNATIVLSVAYSPSRHVLYAGTVDGIYELSVAR